MYIYTWVKKCQNSPKLSTLSKIIKNCQKLSKLSKLSNVSQVMFPHQCDQMSQRSLVSKRSLFNVKKQKWLSHSVTHSVSDKVTYWAVRWQLKKLSLNGVIIGICDIWDTYYNIDNWEPGFMTIIVTWQLIVTLDSIRNSCDAWIQWLKNLWETTLRDLDFWRLVTSTDSRDTSMTSTTPMISTSSRGDLNDLHDDLDDLNDLNMSDELAKDHWLWWL